MPHGSQLGLCSIGSISDLTQSLPNIKCDDDVAVCTIFRSPNKSQLDEASLQLNDWSGTIGAQIS